MSSKIVRRTPSGKPPSHAVQKCSECNGTGRCRACGGTGYLGGPTFPSGPSCAKCNGTGACYWCRGLG